MSETPDRDAPEKGNWPEAILGVVALAVIAGIFWIIAEMLK